MNNEIILREQELLGKHFIVYGTFEEPLFVANDVADWIEHSNVTEMLKTVDEDEKLTSTILRAGQNRKVNMLTENGLYEVLMLSRKPVAKQFKREVKKILKSIRKTGGYKLPQTASEMIQLLAQGSVELSQKIDDVNKDLQDFKQDMPILGVEESKITSAVRRKGVQCLGGKESEAYKDNSLRGKVYADIYGQLKREFGVATYKAIKRNQCDQAVAVIECYQLPIVLEEAINDCNAQMSL